MLLLTKFVNFATIGTPYITSFFKETLPEAICSCNLIKLHVFYFVD